jgi:hypothetical protein
MLVSTDVVPVGSGWSQVRCRQGKYVGAEQVTITRRDGTKQSLSSVSQNLFDAWMRLLGQLLLPISQYIAPEHQYVPWVTIDMRIVAFPVSEQFGRT